MGLMMCLTEADAENEVTEVKWVHTTACIFLSLIEGGDLAKQPRLTLELQDHQLPSSWSDVGVL